MKNRELFKKHQKGLAKLCNTLFILHLVAAFCMRNTPQDRVSLYKKPDIRLCDLDHKFVEGYNTFLRTTEKMQHNLAVKNIKNLIRVIHISIANKWINNNPFKDFSCNYVSNNRVYLTIEEVDGIYHRQFEIEQGKEKNPTFFLQRNLNKPYHIDYCFLSADIPDKVQNVEIGAYENWIAYSDHSPLIIDFDL